MPEYWLPGEIFSLFLFSSLAHLGFDSFWIRFDLRFRLFIVCYDIFHFISPLSCALLMIFILLIALCNTLSSTLYTSFEQLFQH